MQIYTKTNNPNMKFSTHVEQYAYSYTCPHTVAYNKTINIKWETLRDYDLEDINNRIVSIHCECGEHQIKAIYKNNKYVVLLRTFIPSEFEKIWDEVKEQHEEDKVEDNNSNEESELIVLELL